MACVAHCPSHATAWQSGEITTGTIITFQHFQEVKDALHAERKRRYADSNKANFTYDEVVATGNTITNDTISKFKIYIDELRAYNYVNPNSYYTSTANQPFNWTFINYFNTSDPGGPVSEQEIMANSMLEIRTKINDLNNDCICNCNYCTCVCDYCQCNCSYACTCNCNYSCTCNCNYACTCNCNYACTCNCNYACTCNCNYCACVSNYSCRCNSRGGGGS